MDGTLKALISAIVFLILIIVIKYGSNPDFVKKHPSYAELAWLLAFVIFAGYIALIRMGIC